MARTETAWNAAGECGPPRSPWRVRDAPAREALRGLNSLVDHMLGRPAAKGTIVLRPPAAEGTDDGLARPPRGPAAMGRVRSRHCGAGPEIGRASCRGGVA